MTSWVIIQRGKVMARCASTGSFGELGSFNSIWVWRKDAMWLVTFTAVASNCVLFNYDRGKFKLFGMELVITDEKQIIALENLLTKLLVKDSIRLSIEPKPVNKVLLTNSRYYLKPWLNSFYSNIKHEALTCDTIWSRDLDDVKQKVNRLRLSQSLWVSLKG